MKLFDEFQNHFNFNNIQIWIENTIKQRKYYLWETINIQYQEKLSLLKLKKII